MYKVVVKLDKEIILDEPFEKMIDAKSYLIDYASNLTKHTSFYYNLISEVHRFSEFNWDTDDNKRMKGKVLRQYENSNF